MILINMLIELVLFAKGCTTVLAVVGESVWEVNVFNVFPQVATLCKIFAAEVTLMQQRAVLPLHRAHVRRKIGHHA